MSITTTLQPPPPVIAGAAGATGAAGRGAATPPGCCPAAGAMRKRIDSGPATNVAYTRGSLTLSTPCWNLVILTSGASKGGGCRLPVCGNRPLGFLGPEGPYCA